MADHSRYDTKDEKATKVTKVCKSRIKKLWENSFKKYIKEVHKELLLKEFSDNIIHESFARLKVHSNSRVDVDQKVKT